MKFDHAKLDAYRASIEFVAWSYRLSKALKGMDRHARDQLLRASQSIPLNIAEGNGKLPGSDRIRYLQIACGSALECAAIRDVLRVFESVDDESCRVGEHLLHRIVAMLIGMTQQAGRVRETSQCHGQAVVAAECLSEGGFAASTSPSARPSVVRRAGRRRPGGSGTGRSDGCR